MKKILIAAAAVLSLGLVGAVSFGAAAGQAQEGDGPLGSFLSKVADKLGVSEDELETAIDEARDETIDEAVADGHLSEEHAERLKERDGLFPLFRPHICHRGGGFLLEAAATVLDMEEDAVKEQLMDGSSFADIAEENGMGVDEFTSALLDQIQSQLDEKVGENDRFTQEKADAIFERVEENIDDIVSATPGDRPCRGFGRWHGPFPFRGGETDASSEPEAETSDVTA